MFFLFLFLFLLLLLFLQKILQHRFCCISVSYTTHFDAYTVQSRFVRRSFTARSSYEHCMMTLLSSIINCSNIALCSLSLNKKTAVCEEENDGLFLVKRRFIIPNSSFYKSRSRQHNSLRTGKYLKTFDKFNYKAKRRTFSKEKALLKVLSQLISG